MWASDLEPEHIGSQMKRYVNIIDALAVILGSSGNQYTAARIEHGEDRSWAATFGDFHNGSLVMGQSELKFAGGTVLADADRHKRSSHFFLLRRIWPIGYMMLENLQIPP